MAEFTQAEKAFLRELKLRPEWQSILDKIKRDEAAPYKPQAEGTEDLKFHRWIYQSGRARENADIISMLTLGVK